MKIRLQKIISNAGIRSRRGAEKLISNGNVKVNGVIVTELGTKADPEKDVITVFGKRVTVQTTRIYLMMNKPTKYVTTMKDPEGRATVVDLLKDVPERVYPVGRLDYDSSGILLFTNDGEVANKLMHPRHEIRKTYRVKIRGKLSETQLEPLKRENKKLGFRAPHEIREEPASKRQTKHTWYTITISEGKNRQIRRMIESVGGTVLKLERVSYGNLTLEGLKVGNYRELTEKEVSYLKGL